MRTGATIGIVAVAALAVVGAVYMIDVDMTDEGALPEVSMNVEGGELPEFDAEVGEVEVGSREAEVTVPEVEVNSREANVTVPTIEVTPPEENEG